MSFVGTFHSCISGLAAKTGSLLWAKSLRSWRRGSESNRRIKVLQTSPLPLGYRALVPNLAPSPGIVHLAQ